MEFEIDFLAVGEGEKCGDAIAFRYGNLAGGREEQTVFVVDGGTKAAGEALVAHIRKYYETTFVDSVISTHPDLDHASGLTVVMENLDFGNLVMHRPWEHADEIRDLFKTPHTPSRLSDKLQKAVTAAHDLELLATKRGKEIVEPFAGASSADGRVLVLGPSQRYYEELVPEFRSTPPAKQPTILSRAAEALAGGAGAVIEKISMVAEAMNIETLRDDGVTSAENNSSAIILLSIDSGKVLLTADAGIPALGAAADYAVACGVALTDLYLMQIPHHGSRRNVGPTILNRVMGKNAVVSVGEDAGPKHPAKKVTNAFIRRGATVKRTSGSTLCYTNAGLRGWPNAPAIPFYSTVEDY